MFCPIKTAPSNVPVTSSDQFPSNNKHRQELHFTSFLLAYPVKVQMWQHYHKWDDVHTTLATRTVGSKKQMDEIEVQSTKIQLMAGIHLDLTTPEHEIKIETTPSTFLAF
jgi:hypothetical protein